MLVVGWMDRIQRWFGQCCQVRPLSLCSSEERENAREKGDVVFSSGLASLALINTNAAAAAGLVTWTLLDGIRGQVSISGSCIGPIVGLVAVTPACGFIDPGYSLLFGFIPVIIVYFLLLFKHHARFDDTLDVAVVHGIGKSLLSFEHQHPLSLCCLLGGIIGAFMTGLFADISVNPAGANGAFFGHPIQMWYQIAGILTAIG